MWMVMMHVAWQALRQLFVHVLGLVNIAFVAHCTVNFGGTAVNH